MNSFKLKVGFLAYLFLFLHILPAFPQYTPAWEHSSYSELFKLNLTTTDNSTSPEQAYINGYKLALKNLLSETPQADQVTAKLDTYADLITKSDLADHYKNYYRNDLFLWKAVMELKAGNELKFMWMLNRLYSRSSDLINNYRDFKPALKMDALMNIMVGSVPDQYQWIFNLLGYNGNTEKGIEQLKTLSQIQSPISHEGIALYFIITNYLQPELKGTDLLLLENHLNQHPDFYLLHFIAGLSNLKQHQSLKAREYLSRLPETDQYPLFNYFIAETYLHEGQHKQAESYYLSFIENSAGDNLIKDSYFKLFLLAYMNKNISEAAKYKKLAINHGNTRSEADKNASKLLNASQLPHPDLFRLRFATDGGFFNIAMRLIQEMDKEELSLQDEIEFIYRSARAYHLSGRINDAIQQYKLSIQKDDGRYFAPNSALQLGYIYEKQKQYPEASQYFEKALEYEDYTYEISIRSKARNALKNLNK